MEEGGRDAHGVECCGVKRASFHGGFFRWGGNACGDGAEEEAFAVLEFVEEALAVCGKAVAGDFYGLIGAEDGFFRIEEGFL